MLVAEYDYDTDIAVQREEAGKIAFAKGIFQGSRQKKHSKQQKISCILDYHEKISHE